MSGMWEQLWDEAYGPFGRDEMIHDGIDLWGRRLLVETEKPGDPPPAIQAEVACLDWVFRRHRWIINLRWSEIDKWIKAHFPEAMALPTRWSFVRILQDAQREKLGLLEAGV